MSQNSIIAFAILVGFVVFITMKGELSQYLAVMGLSNAALPAGGGTSATSSPGSSTGSILSSLPSISISTPGGSSSSTSGGGGFVGPSQNFDPNLSYGG